MLKTNCASQVPACMHAWAKSSCLALGICLGLGLYTYIYAYIYSSCSIVLARFLQTSSTPAWTLWLSVFNVSQGVRLGCENLYGGTGGLCMETWESGRLTIWKFGNLEFWKSICAYVCREIWDPANSKKIFSKSKSVSPQTSARSGLYKHNAPDFFCKPLRASGRKIG